jgi:Flp pilus assembly protein TadG
MRLGGLKKYIDLFGSVALSYLQNQSGQVAMIFALAAIPILFASSAAIDFGRRNSAKAQIDAALDGAMLATLARKSNTITVLDITSMENQFRTEAARVPGVTITSFTAPVPVVVPALNLSDSSGSTLKLTASYTATIKTTMAAMMNVTTMNIDGMTSGVKKLPQYMEFFLLLDSSPSMGLAATSADINNLKNFTGGCAFACHEHTYDNSGNVTGDKQDDNYHIAQKYNIKLRIQVLRDAVDALVDRANETAALPQQFAMEMWTFNDSATQTQLKSMTSALNSIKAKTKDIDIAYAYRNQSDNQTDFERAIAKMNSVIPASGTGLLATSPVRFLFFVTDGVQDTGGSISNESAGFRINQNRFIGPFNPETCKSLKDKNVRIGIIYTQYMPLYDNGFYNNFVRPYENKIGPSLKACASDGLYYPVASGGDITSAMLTLFTNAVSSVRISQ